MNFEDIATHFYKGVNDFYLDLAESEEVEVVLTDLDSEDIYILGITLTKLLEDDMLPDELKDVMEQYLFMAMDDFAGKVIDGN